MPPPSYLVSDYSVTSSGVWIAALSGAALISGLNFLDIYTDMTKKKTLPAFDYVAISSMFSVLAGGSVTLGVYLLVPSKIRYWWS
jgi:hypothetical protein